MTLTPASTDPLDQLLVDLDPVHSFESQEITESLDALALSLRDPRTRDLVRAQLRRTTPRQRSRRVRWTVIGLVVALTATVGGIPAAAAVSSWLAHTGTFGANRSTTKSGATTDTESDTSEWIGLNASDTNKTLAALYPSYLTLPAGITKGDAIRTIIRLNTASLGSGNPNNGQVIEQSVGIKQTYEVFANCAWYADWLTANTASDTARLARDTAGITTAANFPATAGESPEMTTRLRMYAKLAPKGNRADIERASKELECADFMKGLNG
jgi:hypothetical protein